MICVLRKEQSKSCQVWIVHVATVERSSVHECERVKLTFHSLAKPVDRSSRERERVETAEAERPLRAVALDAVDGMLCDARQNVRK
jgi:hypothetical protein